MDNYRIVKFEDLLLAPFEQASQLYRFAQLSPDRVVKLRLKSKKILIQEGEHATHYGEEHSKYWFDSDSISAILDPAISLRQKTALSQTDKRVFKQHAREVLEFSTTWKIEKSLYRKWRCSQTFMHYPATHRIHLRTSNAIESTFATVRARTRSNKGADSRDAGLIMAFRLLTMAEIYVI